VLLVPFATRKQFSWADQETIGPDNPFFEPKTLCILISGHVKGHWHPNLTLDGVDYPILFVDLPGKRLKTAGRYELLGDIDVLRIRCEGLQEFGFPAYKELVKRVCDEVTKQRLPVGQLAGQAIPMTQTPLDIWRERLGFFQKQEAIAADPAQKFAISNQIQEAKAKISELGG